MLVELRATTRNSHAMRTACDDVIDLSPVFKGLSPFLHRITDSLAGA